MALLIPGSAGIFKTRSVLLAIGRRGTPRKLGVPGEHLSKVVYRLTDPQQFKGQRVLVVGGGDSALEAASTLAEETDATVDLCYRGDTFQRARRKNRERVDAAIGNGRLRVRLKTEVQFIAAKSVVIQDESETPERLENDAIIVCAGGELPNAFLKSIGIETVVKYGEA